jgi:hypothetical protein
MNCRLMENISPQAIHGSRRLLLGANRTYALGEQCTVSAQSRPAALPKLSGARRCPDMNSRRG